MEAERKRLAKLAAEIAALDEEELETQVVGGFTISPPRPALHKEELETQVIGGFTISPPRPALHKEELETQVIGGFTISPPRPALPKVVGVPSNTALMSKASLCGRPASVESASTIPSLAMAPSTSSSAQVQADTPLGRAEEMASSSTTHAIVPKEGDGVLAASEGDGAPAAPVSSSDGHTETVLLQRECSCVSAVHAGPGVETKSRGHPPLRRVHWAPDVLEPKPSRQMLHKRARALSDGGGVTAVMGMPNAPAMAARADPSPSTDATCELPARRALAKRKHGESE